MTNIYYNTKSVRGKIQSEYSNKDLDQVANLGINQSKVRISQNTQKEIKIRILAFARLRVKPEPVGVLESGSGAFQSRL